MDEETTKAGYRKVFVTLVGLIVALVAVLWPTDSEKVTVLGALAINFGVPVLDAIVVCVYNWLNTRQKNQLAQANVAKIQATTEQLKVLAANPALAAISVTPITEVK
jgi:Cu/Ag efflux pump CusA